MVEFPVIWAAITLKRLCDRLASPISVLATWHITDINFLYEYKHISINLKKKSKSNYEYLPHLTKYE